MKYHRKLQLISTLFFIQDNSQKGYAWLKSPNFFSKRKIFTPLSFNQTKKMVTQTSTKTNRKFLIKFRDRNKNKNILKMILMF